MLEQSKMATVSAVKKLKVAELREELAEKGLNSKGNKQELIDRLTEFIEANTTGDDAALDNDGAEETENRAPTLEGITTEEEAGLLDQDLEAITTEEEAAILDPDPKEDADLEDEGVVKKTDIPDDPPKLTPITPPQVAKEMVPEKEVITEIDKKKSRAERFSSPLTEDAKKAARAQRFGVSSESPPKTTTKATTKPSSGVISSVPVAVTPAEVDKLKKRAARFGAVVSPVVEKSEQQERLLKRKERFGANTTTTQSITGGGETDAKKKKRAERFGL